MSTGIEWTDETWNPVTGCSVVSPGCTNCYAAAVSHRFHRTTKPWTAPNAAENVRAHPERLDQPLRWKKPRRIFVNSMSDLFHEQVPDAFIWQVFGVMALAPQHTFQILTKRPQRMRGLLSREPGEVYRQIRNHAHYSPGGLVSPLPNVWLGVSVEDQRRADERIPLLLQTPAAVRWVSAEPLLETVDFGPWLKARRDTWFPVSAYGEARVIDWPALSWIVCGGESGPGARPCDLSWLRAIVDQCRAASVPCFVKQVGSKPYFAATADDLWLGRALRDRKGGDPAEWPEDLRAREYPEAKPCAV